MVSACSLSGAANPPSSFQVLTSNLLRQVPITMVIGEAIEVAQVDNPTEEQIDELHQRFMVALRDLFDEYKHKVKGGWQNKQLHIV